MPAVILADSYYFNCSYDENNNRIKVEHSDGLEQFYEYDNINRLIHYISMRKHDKIVDVNYVYNDNEKSKTIYSEGIFKEKIWFLDKDFEKVLKKETEDHKFIYYTYDEEDRLVEMKDENDIIERITYLENNTVEISSSLGISETKQFSNTGKILKYIDNKGIETIYEYDSDDRLYHEYSSNHRIDNVYFYNDKDRITIITDKIHNRVKRQEFNDKGLIIREEDYMYIKKYNYDSNGNLISYLRIYNEDSLEEN